MARKLTNNNAQFQRAVKRLPLGVASNFRYWGEDRTIYVKHGKGARIVDLDDNVYVDYRMGYGPAILGYADERVDAAAREGMEVGGVFALVHRARAQGRRAHFARWCRPPSSCASRTREPRRSWRGCGSRAPTPERTIT